jgi:hypothetical protein
MERERVVFQIEDTGERIACLLNPESLVLRRRAGIRQRESGGGVVTGNRMTDDSLIYTGGGLTSIELDLVFDVSVAGSSIATEDVRELTEPLWCLAENADDPQHRGKPRVCRLFWGKSWNIPAVVAAVSERLEQFNAEGVPRRSWLRMRLLRCRLPEPSTPTGLSVGVSEGEGGRTLARVHEVVGGDTGVGGETGPLAEPLSLIAFRETGDAANWRAFGLDDPMSLLPGQLLEIPENGSE